MRAFFEARGFVETDTPILVPSPGTEPHIDAFRVEGEPPRFLIPSPELQMKRLLGAGLDRIYQVGPCFRRGEEGSHHQPEFTMVEWYRANAGADDVMRDTEELVAEVAQALTGACVIPGAEPTFARIDVRPPWTRWPFGEAFRALAGEDALELLRSDQARFFRTLAVEVQPRLGRRAVFLTKWPAETAALALLSPEDPTVSERFEAYIDGVELCNGWAELVDAAEQRRRFEADLGRRAALGKEPYPIDERFLAALEAGLPPCAGNALGFDRLLMLITGATSIDDVRPFPTSRL